MPQNENMEQKIEPLQKEDIEWLQKNREWLVGHFDKPEEYSTVSAKLQLIETLLKNNWVKKDETAKLHALGIAFGDALEQEVEELSWVAVEDEIGRDPALRWLNTSVLVFPHTSISKRVEGGVEFDVYEMFGGFQKAIHEALNNEA
jgi:hypothetical protein